MPADLVSPPTPARILPSMTRDRPDAASEAPATAKERILDVLAHQPDDASFDDLLRELAFRRLVDRGLSDARAGRTLETDQLLRRIGSWDG